MMRPQLTILRQPPETLRYKEIVLKKADVHDGHLILVNRDHPLHRPIAAGETVPLPAHIQPAQVAPAEITLEKTCLQQLDQLLQACQALDQIVVVSGYRSPAEQQDIYETSLRERGPAFTASYVARPGQSEHQTGLAVDVGEKREEVDFICPSFPDQGVCLRFKQLAAEYGFIQRYREGKEHLTHISCEPWHFRYVGVPHALLIEQHAFCLEEYIGFLKQYRWAETHLYVRHKGYLYEIYYVAAERELNLVPIMEGEIYQVSGNNQDGFIVTVIHPKGSEHRDQ